MTNAPPAVDPRWIELFRREFDDMAQRLDAAADALSREYSVEHVNAAFRAIHTIKGNSYAIGLAGVGDLAHQFERALGAIRDGGNAPDGVLGELMLDVTDALRRLVDAPGEGAPPELLGRIARLLPGGPGGGTGAAGGAAAQPPASGAPANAVAPPPKALRSEALVIPVDVNELDDLVAATEALRALAQAGGDTTLARRAEDLSRGLLAIRTLGVSRIVPRLRRLVRDTARALAKPVALEVVGEDLDGDAAVIRDLSEALPHLLRNAIDHGLEKPGERESIAKRAEGRVALRFIRGSDAFLVEVEDDGHGMDPDAILEKALRRGLVTEEAGARLDRDDRLRLIFLPGFSTKEEATETSGRGVGMDVVASVVERHRGRIDIHTRRGAGTRFVLRFPALFRYEEYLVVELDGRPIGLPVRYVAEILEREDAPVPEDGLVVLHGEALPVIGFQELDPGFGGPERRALVVLGFERGRMAMAVDALAGFTGTLIQPPPGRGGIDFLAGVGQAPDGRQLWGIDLEKVGHGVEAYRVAGWDGGVGSGSR